MDRRQFLAAGSLAVAVAAPTLARASTSAATASTAVDPALSSRVNFHADGLDFNPAEYAAVLRAMAAA
ncbi:MAG: hypothetical protein ACREO3_11840, partial [Arenimonas sp.]